MSSTDTVLVTGGTGLIGEAIVDAFVEAGHDVVVTSRDYDRATEFVGQKKTDSEHDRYIPLELDLGEEASITNAVETLTATDQLPSILVANASARDALGPDFSQLSHAEFAHLFKVDIAGQVLLSRFLYENVSADDGLRSVTFLSSIYGSQGVDQQIYTEDMSPTPVHYTAVKAAVHGVIRTLASRWSPHTRVNSIVAGGVRTDERQDPEFVNKYEDKTMLERMAEPSEIADAVKYISSERASYITAQSIVVDGGYSSW